MADSISSVYDIKFGWTFADDASKKYSFTFPNPKNVTAVKAGLSTIENIALQNNLLIGNYGDSVKALDDVEIVVKNTTKLNDWR